MLNGRCGPCCSMAPSGCTMMLDALSASSSCGARSSSRRRDVETDDTRSRYAADPTARETGGVSEQPESQTFDAIVVGAGHNGLVTAAYLARGGMKTLLLEARSHVGGTAASESFGGATVNICNCDHLTFRTTPVISELPRCWPWRCQWTRRL